MKLDKRIPLHICAIIIVILALLAIVFHKQIFIALFIIGTWTGMLFQ